MKTVDLCIIGGGAAGLAVALKASEHPIRICLIEASHSLGGILNQCIHAGFGLSHFSQNLTGPEYAHRVTMLLQDKHITLMLNTTVTTIHENQILSYINESGANVLGFKALVLTTGSKERNRFDINLMGPRISGIYTAGLAQAYMNYYGHRVGNKVLIVGSGDIGLIMARRMRLEGADVLGVVEMNPYSSGLSRNVAQCLEDFDIPLYLSHVVVSCKGTSRLSGVVIQAIDKGILIDGTQKEIACDTLLLSVGLLPENRLLKGLDIVKHSSSNQVNINEFFQTSLPYVFVCGNALHIHDLVDDVSKEGALAGLAATTYLLDNLPNTPITSHKGEGISYVIPHAFSMDQNPKTLAFRVSKPMKHVVLHVKQGHTLLKETKHKILLPSMMEHLSFELEKGSLEAITLEVVTC